jgi:hypothetical protein
MTDRYDQTKYFSCDVVILLHIEKQAIESTKSFQDKKSGGEKNSP